MPLLRISVPITGKTGEINPKSGDYKCSIHTTQIIPLTKGEKFPPCNTRGYPAHGAKWILVKAR